MKKTVLILGGSSDIGYEVILKFLKNGWKVISQYNFNNKSLNKLKKNYAHNLLLIKSNFEKNSSFNAFLKKINNLHISSLINLVGFIDNVSFEKANLENMKKCIQINTLVPILIQKKVIDKMKDIKFGRILHISSIGVKYGGGENTFNYSFSKNALEFIPSHMKNLVKYNILTNVLRVGFVKTKLTKKIKNKNINQRIKLIPIGRSADKQEISDMIYFLASEKNTYISNEKITIAGGE